MPVEVLSGALTYRNLAAAAAAHARHGSLASSCGHTTHGAGGSRGTRGRGHRHTAVVHRVVMRWSVVGRKRCL